MWKEVGAELVVHCIQQFQLCKMKTFWKSVAQPCEYTNTTDCILQNGEDGQFYVL